MMRNKCLTKSATFFLALFFILLLFTLALVLPASQVTRAQMEADWITWEDYDSHLIYSLGWRIAVPESRAIGGQLSTTSTAGASLTFQIQIAEATGGYSIRYASGPDGGTFEVRVNNTVRQYSSYSETEIYNREITDGSLPTGNYTITITNGGGVLQIEAILVKGIPTDNSRDYSPTPTDKAVIATPIPYIVPFASAMAQTGSFSIVYNAQELATAIAATTGGGPTNIYLEQGDYTISNPIHIPANVEVSLFGTEPITVYSAATDGIAVTGLTGGLDALFNISGYSKLNIHHLRLIGGTTSRNYGGIIRNSGVLRIFDSVLENTQTNNGGGAIYNLDGTITIERSTFRNNKAGGGGAI